MKTIRALLSVFALLGALALAPATATAAASCAEAAERIAARTGGEVLNVVSEEQDGATVCQITVRIPGKDGNPPRVVTRTVNG